MPLAARGPIVPIDVSAEQRTVVLATVRQVFVNETPLYARLPRRPAEGPVYTKTFYQPRGRAYLVGTGGITNSATSLPIADATPFLVGDVLELTPAAGGTAERVEVTADPTTTTTPNTLTIRRGREGTTGTAYSAADIITLIGNSRTGAEINQNSNRPVRGTFTQNVQTFQYPVQVGGLVNAIMNVALPPGFRTVYDIDRATKLLDGVRDIEYTSYYGLGEAVAADGDRAKQKGLRTLISLYNGGANVSTSTKAAFTRLQFISTCIQPIFDAGGMPDTVLCSTDMLTGLSVWAPQTQPVAGTRTNFIGQPITELVLPIGAYPLTFVPSLQLKKGTMVVLTRDDLAMRDIRELAFYPRGVRGDAIEGDFIGDSCIDLDHPQWHFWAEGITGFA